MATVRDLLDRRALPAAAATKPLPPPASRGERQLTVGDADGDRVAS